jgi:hypothetical protein
MLMSSGIKVAFITPVNAKIGKKVNEGRVC